MNPDLQRLAFNFAQQVAPGNSAVADLIRLSPYISPDSIQSNQFSFPSVGTDFETGQRGVNLGNFGIQSQEDFQKSLTPIDQPIEIPEGTVLSDNQQRWIGEEAPTGLRRVGAALLDWASFGLADKDKRGNLFGGQHSQSGFGLAPTPEQTKKENKKARADAYLERQLQLSQLQFDPKYRRALLNETADAQLDLMKRAYPIQQAAAWDATKRALYGDKMSLSARQRRRSEAAAAEGLREKITSEALRDKYLTAYMGLQQRSPIT